MNMGGHGSHPFTPHLGGTGTGAGGMNTYHQIGNTYGASTQNYNGLNY